MIPPDIGHAHEIRGRGVQATCPTTGNDYITSQARFTTMASGARAVWCTCRHCDTHARIRTDEDFDPSQPQPHLYLLDEVA